MNGGGCPNNKLQQSKLAQSDGASLLNLVLDGQPSGGHEWA